MNSSVYTLSEINQQAVVIKLDASFIDLAPDKLTRILKFWNLQPEACHIFDVSELPHFPKDKIYPIVNHSYDLKVQRKSVFFMNANKETSKDLLAQSLIKESFFCDSPSAALSTHIISKGLIMEPNLLTYVSHFIAKIFKMQFQRDIEILTPFVEFNLRTSEFPKDKTMAINSFTSNDGHGYLFMAIEDSMCLSLCRNILDTKNCSKEVYQNIACIALNILKIGCFQDFSAQGIHFDPLAPQLKEINESISQFKKKWCHLIMPFDIDEQSFFFCLEVPNLNLQEYHIDTSMGKAAA